MNPVAKQQRVERRVERRIQHDPVLAQVLQSKRPIGAAAEAMFAAAERRAAQIKREVS